LKERRSLYELIFGKRREPPQNRTQLKMLNGYAPVFTDFSGDAYDSDVVRAAVDAIARNAAKLRPKHIRRVNGEVQHKNSYIEKLLAVRPNPYMDAYSFYYKVITQLYMQNNAFIFVDWDRLTGNIRSFYPINASTVEFQESNEAVYVKFQFMGGQYLVLPYEEVIHLRRFFYQNDLYGEPSDKPLNPVLRLIQTVNDGIINAIKSSAFLRGILKFTSMLKPEDMRKQRDEFVRDYLDINNNGGIAATDAKAEYIDLKSNPKMISGQQMDLIEKKVYNYFGVNEKIVQANYTEDEWNAFYESVIEPLAVQMSLEFTAKIFTDQAKNRGNEIIFEANRLQYASMTTKLNLREMVDRGAMTPNEWRNALNMAPLEGRDKPIQRLDTAEVDQTQEVNDDEQNEGESDKGVPDDGDPGSGGTGN